MDEKVNCVRCKKEMIDYEESEGYKDGDEPEYCIDCGNSFCNDCYKGDLPVRNPVNCSKCHRRFIRCVMEVKQIFAKLKEKREKEKTNTLYIK